MAVKDELGNRYGQLTVLSRAENNARGDAQWVCSCDCGKTIVVLGKSLRSGNTKSCGCLQKNIARAQGLKNTAQFKIGQRFGDLTVLRRVPGDKNKLGLFECKCDCGNIIFVRTAQLSYQKIRSCGCVKSKGESLIAQLLSEYKISFKKEVSFSDFYTPKGRRYRFDFGLYEDNYLICLIEYDGKQHYYESGFGCDSLEERQIKDKIKNDYCKYNNIRLYRIKYDEDIVIELNKILEKEGLL